MILVFSSGGMWHVQYTGKIAEEIRDLFETDVLPTPYSCEMPYREVAAILAVKNPGIEIKYSAWA